MGRRNIKISQNKHIHASIFERNSKKILNLMMKQGFKIDPQLPEKVVFLPL